MNGIDFNRLSGGLRLAGAAAAIYVAVTGKVPGAARAGLALAALALGVHGFAQLTAASGPDETLGY